MANISKGTYMSDGARVGPTFNLPANNNPVLINPGSAVPIYVLYSGNNNLDQGVLLAPWNVYTITPNAPADTFTQFNNVAAATDFAGAAYFTLLGDNSVTTLVRNQQGNNQVVFDWPRQVAITSSANVGAVTVTIFGLDVYGFPLQQSVTAATSATTVYTQKAFSVVTAAYASSATTGTTTISLGASGTGFGLPYAVTDYSYIQAYYQGGAISGGGAWSSGFVVLTGATPVVVTPPNGVPSNRIITLGMISPNGNTANSAFVSVVNPGIAGTGNFSITSIAGDLSIIQWTITMSTSLAITVADQTSPATQSTGDVRGIVTTPQPVNGTAILTVYMNVQGANNWINQQAALNPPGGAAINDYVPLTLQNLVGVPQYYTGNPA